MILTFILGAALGWIVSGAITFSPILTRLDWATDNINRNTEKLVQARKRLGQIANRQSINEARKIANIGLKELSK